MSSLRAWETWFLGLGGAYCTGLALIWFVGGWGWPEGAQTPYRVRLTIFETVLWVWCRDWLWLLTITTDWCVGSIYCLRWEPVPIIPTLNHILKTRLNQLKASHLCVWYVNTQFKVCFIICFSYRQHACFTLFSWNKFDKVPTPCTDHVNKQTCNHFVCINPNVCFIFESTLYIHYTFSNWILHIIGTTLWQAWIFNSYS